MAPSGETVTPRCAARSVPGIGSARRTIGRSVSRHSSITSTSGGTSASSCRKSAPCGSLVTSSMRRPAGLRMSTRPCRSTTQQPGGEAVDDLRAQLLGGDGTGAHRLLLGLQPGDRFLQRRGDSNAGSPRAARAASRVPRADDEAQQGEGQDAHQHRRRARSAPRSGIGRCRSWSAIERMYQVTIGSPTTAATRAPTARKVPNGNAAFMPPRPEAIRPTPTSDPANDASTSVTQHQLPAEERADHRQHLHVAHAQALDAAQAVVRLADDEQHAAAGEQADQRRQTSLAAGRG